MMKTRKTLVITLLGLMLLIFLSGCDGKAAAKAIITPNSEVDYGEIADAKW